MGRRFIGNFGGKGTVYSCRNCDTYLTSHGEMTSPNFNGSTGPAMLFYKVWNIDHGKMESRKMTTGWHVVRDVMCTVCKRRVGWMYEMACEQSQEYKEGQVILECGLINNRTAIDDPLGDDVQERRLLPMIPTLERPPGRIHHRRRQNRESEISNRSGSESNDSVSSLSSTNTSV